MAGTQIEAQTCIIEKQSTGAATLLIHMLRIIATNIFVIRTILGLFPAFESTRVAIILAIWYFDSAAAIVKPPKSNIMTGVHMAAKTAFVASLASSRWCGSSSLLIT